MWLTLSGQAIPLGEWVTSPFLIFPKDQENEISKLPEAERVIFN
ncbi:MAG TPA: hypothetical protein VMW41_00995 [Candidatus Bathyarchaeia archaeon]|nr:hypothetical protein [Candidatus Bathyarchaeia archaeon]